MNPEKETEGMFCPKITCPGKMVQHPNGWTCSECGEKVIDFSDWTAKVKKYFEKNVSQAWREVIRKGAQAPT